MEEILVIGQKPKDFLDTNIISAFNHRSKQVIDHLIQSNYKIILLNIDKKNFIEIKKLEFNGNLIIYDINPNKFGWLRLIKKEFKQYNFRFICAMTLLGGFVARKLNLNKLLWLDLYGEPMLEKIGRDSITKKEIGTWFIYSEIKKLFKTCDVFSVCSDSQKQLTIGALIYLGRIRSNNWTSEKVFTLNYWGTETAAIKTDRKENNKIGMVYNGSINTWTDVDTLSEVISEVLKKKNNVYFKQFGIDITDGIQLEKFHSYLIDSDFKDRVEFLGAIDDVKAQEIYKRCHICINADVDTLETQFGWRTRYTAAIRNGLVIIATLGNDMPNKLSMNGCGLFSEIGDKQKLKENLLRVIDDPKLRSDLIQKGNAFLDTNVSIKQFGRILAFISGKNAEKEKKTKGIFTHQIKYIYNIFRNCYIWLKWNVLYRVG